MGNRDDDQPVGKLREFQSARHDRYVPDTCSGRIVCNIVTEDPIFVGNRRVRGGSAQAPAIVGNFELDANPAIPASSLRGMISALAEAASNSTLRVLHDAKYSYRKPMKHHLSAIGMLLRQDDGSWRLRPLTASHDVPASVNTHRKVFFGDHNSIQQNGTAAFPYKTFDINDPSYYYMRLAPTLNTRGQFVIARNSEDLLPLDQAAYDALPPGERSCYTRGILRVLGVHGRDDVPVYQPGPPIRHGKKHELFLPYPEDIETRSILPVPEWVIARFHDLADERTATRAVFPYELHGTQRGGQDNKVRLQHGSLVYYREANGQVREVSLSSIWREAAASGEMRFSTHQYFKQMDRQLVPSKYFADYNNAAITIAERLFGFVEDRPSNAQLSRPAAALASRLRFSHALYEAGPDTGPYLEEVTLKILDSPKPPSPAMYFRPRGRYARRSNELNPINSRPKGRKFYLHRQLLGQHLIAEPWRHQPQAGAQWDYTQQVRIRPIAKGVTFSFEIRFDNLSHRELGLLLYALRPTQAFRHKIGMGKPLGLGKIRIDITGLELVDRQQRYTWGGLLSARASDCLDRLSELRTHFVPDERVHNAISLLGNPDVHRPVHYPVANDQAPYSETELFKWFVNNNKLEHPNPLPDLDGATALPMLEPNGQQTEHL